MAAPKNNQFWKLRSKHGRDKIFGTPEVMWDAACEYFTWIEENPLIEIDFRGSNPPVKVEIPKMRAMTLEGLCSYLSVNRTYFNDFADSIKGKKDELSLGFSDVLTRIRETLYRQKFEGAAGGFLNPNIIARDLGLSDKQEIEVTKFPDIPNVTID